MKKSDRVVRQFSSGRWILTVLAGWAFFLFSVGIVYVIVKQRAEFKPETIVAMFSALLLVVQGVYHLYFNKNGEDSEPQDGGGNPPPEPPAK